MSSVDGAAAREALGDGPMVVLCAGNNWDTVRLHDQHMAFRLAELAPVLYVDPPISPLTPRRKPEVAHSVRKPGLRVISPNLVRVTPLVLPGPQRPGMTSVTSLLARRWIGSAVRTLRRPVRALITSWPLLGVEGAAGEELTVFWAQDDWSGGAELLGLDAERVRRGEAERAKRAAVVVASNPVLAERWRTRGHTVHLIPFGCDASRFAGVDHGPRAADVSLPRPIAGVIGQLNARTDLRLLEAVAERGRSLLLVGPYLGGLDEQRFQALIARENVSWVGQRPFEAIASYLAHVDVGLVPYADTPFNRGSFPLKTLEYLAAGRAVVATDLPAIRWLDSDLIRVASEPEPFAAAVDDAFGGASDVTEVERRRAFASAQSWQVRARELATVLGY